MVIFPPASVDAPPVARVCGVRIPKPTVLLPGDHWGFQVFFYAVTTTTRKSVVVVMKSRRQLRRRIIIRLFRRFRRAQRP